jgi:hypothetical protein
LWWNAGSPSGTMPPAPIPMADGGDFMVNKPTLFLAGEAGPERATFSGANKVGGGQGNTTINNVYPDMRGASVEAVEALHRMVVRLDASVEQRAVGAVSATSGRGAR